MHGSSPTGLERREAPSFDDQLRQLISSRVSPGIRLSPLKGFKLNLSGNTSFRKFFYSARCDCGTAALLSVEVARDKTFEEIESVLPRLVQRLEGQATAFYGMTCESHKRLRGGPAA